MHGYLVIGNLSGYAQLTARLLWLYMVTCMVDRLLWLLWLYMVTCMVNRCRLLWLLWLYMVTCMVNRLLWLLLL